MCLANKTVRGRPRIAPQIIDTTGDSTGKPSQDPMREAKKIFTAAAPIPNG